MADDARISTAFPRHPKTVKLYRRLKERGCWSLVCLFLWVADDRPNGDLSGKTGEDIEIAASWRGEPGAFVAALREVGFLDGEELAYKVHDWAEHNPWAANKGQRIECAKRAAAARWESREDGLGMRSAPDPHTERMRPEQKGNALHYSPPTPHHTPPKTKSGADAPPLPDWIPLDAWAAFEEMRKKIRKPLTPRATQLIVKKLGELRAAGNDPGAVLDRSTVNCWRDVFELKDSGAKLAKPNGRHVDLGKQDYTKGLVPQPGGAYRF